MLGKLASLLCRSLRIVIDRLVLNTLNNKAQIPTFVKVLTRFTALLNAVVTHQHINVLIDSMRTQLDNIVANRNEKMFQSYVILLRNLITQETTLVDAKDFYELVLKNFLTVSTSTHLLFAFEVINKFNTLYKFIVYISTYSHF